MYADGDVQLQNIDRRKFDQYNYISEDEEEDDYEVSSDEQAADRKRAQRTQNGPPPAQQSATQNWNDIPEGFLDPAPQGKKSISREHNHKKKGEWDDWGT
jgi:hypothetical protein